MFEINPKIILKLYIRKIHECDAKNDKRSNVTSFGPLLAWRMKLIMQKGEPFAILITFL